MAFVVHESVLDGVRNNDEQSWQQFVTVYTPLVRLAGRDLHVPEMYLDDLIQNVFLTMASGQLEKFDTARGNFIYYFRGIIRNKAYELLRSINRQEKVKEILPKDEEAVTDPDPFQQEWQRHIRRQIRTVLRQNLSPFLFQVFELLYIHNKTALQVSQQLNKPLSSVYLARNQIQKTCRRLRNQLLMY